MRLRVIPEQATQVIRPRARAVAGGVLEAILYTAAVGSAPGQALGVEAPGGAAGGEPPA